jgi:hypothetical protein
MKQPSIATDLFDRYFGPTRPLHNATTAHTLNIMVDGYRQLNMLNDTKKFLQVYSKYGIRFDW